MFGYLMEMEVDVVCWEGSLMFENNTITTEQKKAKTKLFKNNLTCKGCYHRKYRKGG